MKNQIMLIAAMSLSLATSPYISAQDSTASGRDTKSEDSKLKKIDAGMETSDQEKLREWLSVQVLLDRAGFSPGELDGLPGKNSEKAITWFQKAAKLEPSGKLDEETSAALMAAIELPELLIEYTITEADMKGPFNPEIPKEMADQAKLDGLYYTDAWEMFGERFHTKPEVLKQLNEGKELAANLAITVPNVEPVPLFSDEKMYKEAQKAIDSEEKAKSSDNDDKADKVKQSEEKDSESSEKSKDKDEPEKSEKEEDAKAEDKPSDSSMSADTSLSTQSIETFPRKPEGDLTITVSKKDSQLTLADENQNVIFSAPVTTGSDNDPLPLGEWKVNGTERYPKFNYNPELFWDAEEDDKKAKIPAGPNGPVGVAWIDITKDHYGLHGTPEPGKIGYTESHGCVRLTNWDVMRLSKIVKKDTKVLFVE